MNKTSPLALFIRRGLLAIIFLGIVPVLFAQGAPETEDSMRTSGKIYVVVAVCLTILVGLIFYVYTIDRKVSRLEKESK
jgi:Na+/proline symporter